MIVEKTLIELDEKTLKEILCKHFNLKEESSSVNIIKQDGDMRDPGYTKITITGVKKV